MVSYLIEERQVDFLGNQLVTLQCYQVVLNAEHFASEEVCLKSSNTNEQKQSLSLTANDPTTADPLQPLCLSHGTDQITYTSSLLMRDELELLGSVLQ